MAIGEPSPAAQDEDHFAATAPRQALPGLGLTIARKLVEAHGGSIRAESAAGEGATFVLELPLSD